jgi:hypothetical protein
VREVGQECKKAVTQRRKTSALRSAEKISAAAERLGVVLVSNGEVSGPKENGRCEAA